MVHINKDAATKVSIPIETSKEGINSSKANAESESGPLTKVTVAQSVQQLGSNKKSNDAWETVATAKKGKKKK